MSTFLISIHVITCVLLVFVVLIQSGKDGGIGMMAGGSSQTVFGSSGGANFFTKFTSAAAAVFMITSIFLSVVKSGNQGSVFDQVPAQQSANPVSTTNPATPDTNSNPASPQKTDVSTGSH